MPIQAQTVQYGPWNMGVRYDVPAEDVPVNGLHGMENTRLTQSERLNERWELQAMEVNLLLAELRR